MAQRNKIYQALDTKYLVGYICCFGSAHGICLQEEKHRISLDLSFKMVETLVFLSAVCNYKLLEIIHSFI